MSDKWFAVRIRGMAGKVDFLTFGGWTRKEARACVEENIAEDRAELRVGFRYSIIAMEGE